MKSVKHLYRFLITSLMFLMAIVWSVDSWASKTTAMSRSHSTGIGQELIIQVLGFLFLFMVVMVFSVFVGKRLMRSSNTQGHGFTVVSSMTISPQLRLMVVEVGEVQLILGIGPQSVTRLHTFDSPVIPVLREGKQGHWTSVLSNVLSKGQVK